MIHHVSFGTNDVARARAFYDAIMDVLGMRQLMLDDYGVHYGTGDIQFSLIRPSDGRAASAGNGAHIAFVARDRAMVDRFFAVAIDRGGSSDGVPGVRADYDPHYYAAFVHDPDGNKIEAVTMAAS